jgi:acyl-coenzyme A thioesterase PaaI-like protein
MSTANVVVNKAEGFARSCHPSCVACGDPKDGGLGLRFRLNADDSVQARFPCGSRYEGYPSQLHGGIIAMLLDAAMMHWLFAHGVVGVTTRIGIQFRHPVLVDTQADVRASLLHESPSYYVLRAELIQDGLIRAVGEGVFTDKAPGGAEGDASQ